MKTVVKLEPLPIINLNSQIFSVGSCFAKDFAKAMIKKGIYVFVNPFGTIYNSYSVYKVFDILINKKEYKQDDIYNYNDKFFSFEHSTIFDSDNINQTLIKINDNIKEAYVYIKTTNIFIITLGTSLVYRYKKDKKIVANCHKLPNDFFEKTMLSIEENVKYLQNTINLIKGLNKKAKIIFTVSPVRHNAKDLQVNSFSKSLLRVSVEKILNKNQNIFYFPSYEIVMDELRDYKFYKKDGLHLKKSSFNIVLERFIDAYFSQDLQSYVKQFKKYKLFKKHKVKNKSDNHYFSLLMQNIDLLYNLFSKRSSIVLLKELSNLVIKTIRYFYKENSQQIKDKIKSIFIKNNDIADFFLSATNILDKTEKESDFENKFAKLVYKYPFLNKFYKKILLEYYYGKKEYLKIKQIYKTYFKY